MILSHDWWSQNGSPLTVGVEEEFILVDASGHPVDAMELVLGGTEPVEVPRSGVLKPELFACMVEVATHPFASVDDAGDALVALRAELVTRAAEHGLFVCASGTHPLVDGAGRRLVENPRYASIARQLDELGLLDEQLACGLHVHVGMPTAELALEAAQQLTALAPMFIALAANSPWWQGELGALASTRSELQRRLPWAAYVPTDLGVAAYRELDGAAHDSPSGRLRWEVTPVPEHGTVEVRVMDVQHDPEHTRSLVAFVQALCARVVAGETLATRPAPSTERHNRWAALRDGVAAGLELPGRGERVSVTELTRELLAAVAGAADELGSRTALTGIEHLLAENGAPRQRRLAAAGGSAGLLAGLRLEVPALHGGATA
ncbi:MAG: carboxylate-amine ligase [Thermoleophilia bacterium]|nr:carboxylate-amine ligase [Thermoleophilia bacterium]